MKLLNIILLLAVGTVAFPGAMTEGDILTERAPEECKVSKECDRYMHVSDEAIGVTRGSPTPAQKISASRTNCGFAQNCVLFDKEAQYISTTGQYAYRSPAASDIRGPCPGLNAAANHGYLPRTGILTVESTIEGLGKAYSMTPELALILAIYTIGIDGDIITMTWSIGGPQPLSSLGKKVIGPGLLSRPQGISYSHNKYEGDTSISRCDAYINNGDAHSSSTTRFGYSYVYGLDDDRFTLDKFSQAFTKNTIRSVAQNPLYFANVFSTTVVAPAAYNFVINFMSNHTAEEKSGYLDKHTWKTFFSMKGEYPNFYWEPGQDRIPDNWYKRPVEEGYSLASIFEDLAPEFAAYPLSFRFGGNVKGKNSYVGVDIKNFTNGLYDASDLTDPKNLACFVYLTEQQAIPDELRGGFNDFNKAVDLLLKQFDKSFAVFNCPKVGKFNDNSIKKFPGHRYRPHGPATNC